MKLTQEEYKALEEIVGPEYITQDPVIMESYCQVWGNKLEFGDKRHRPPAAVLMPGSTEEIQAIVRFCNQAGILFKPSARAFEYVATYLSDDRGILLELKRMNRILEIDPKNMHAVVEPFVTVYQLHRRRQQAGLLRGQARRGIQRRRDLAGLLPPGDDHLPALHQRLRAQRAGLPSGSCPPATS